MGEYLIIKATNMNNINVLGCINFPISQTE